MTSSPTTDAANANSSANANNNVSNNASGGGNGSSQSGSNVNILDVLNVVSWHRSNASRVRLLRVSLSIVKFLMALNLLYTLAAASVVVMIAADKYGDQDRQVSHAQEATRNKLFKLGLFVCTLAPLAITIDLLALKGLQVWRRHYLLPWLLFYGFITALMFFHAFNGLLVQGNSVFAIILVCSICFMSAWKQVRRQFTSMGHETNAPVARSIEELAQDLRRSHNSHRNRDIEAADPPPKYDDLEQPPIYSEAVQQANISTDVRSCSER